MKYHIDDHIGEHIYKFLKDYKGVHTRQEVAVRKFVETVWHRVRGGNQWRLLPSYYGCCHAVHQRFRRWSRRGIWQSLFEHCPH